MQQGVGSSLDDTLPSGPTPATPEAPAGRRFRFGAFLLDEDRQELRRGAELVPLRPLPYRLLRQLLCARPRVVTKRELLQRLWTPSAGSDLALAAALRDLRRALGDRALEPRFVRTLRGRGLQFAAPVEELPAAQQRLPSRPPGPAPDQELRQCLRAALDAKQRADALQQMERLVTRALALVEGTAPAPLAPGDAAERTRATQAPGPEVPVGDRS